MDTNVVISHCDDGVLRKKREQKNLEALSWTSLDDQNAIKRFVNVVRAEKTRHS